MSLQKNLKQADIVYERLVGGGSKELLQAYKSSLKEIQAQTADFYRKYAGKEGTMTMAEVSKYNRLRNLEQNITKEITSLGNTQVKVTSKTLSSVYQENFYRQAFAIDNVIRMEHQAYLQFGILPKEQVAAAVNNPLDLITAWPERAKGNINLMRRNISDTITRGIIQGKSYPQMANDIKDWYDKEAWKADRIIRTEAHRVREQGTQNAFEQAKAEGVQMKKRWGAALDDRTRDEHGAADGQEVGVDEKFMVGGEELEYPGDPSGSAENVINCRCSMEPVVGGFRPDVRRVRLTDEEYNAKLEAAGGDKSKVSRSEVRPYQTYDQWAKDHGVGKYYQGAEPRVPGVVRHTDIGEWQADLYKNDRDASNAVINYTRGDFAELRDAQLNPQGATRAALDVVDDMNRALETAPIYEGDVYRGLNGVNSDVIKSFEPGQRITFDSFQSFSKAQDVAEAFAMHDSKTAQLVGGSDNIIFKAQSKTGKYIAVEEREVLFQKGAKFDVIGVKERPISFGSTQGSAWEVSLAEVF